MSAVKTMCTAGVIALWIVCACITCIAGAQDTEAWANERNIKAQEVLQSPDASLEERTRAEQHIAEGATELRRDEETKAEVAHLEARQARVVNEHRMIPFQIVDWPIVTTRFSTVTALGPFHTQVTGQRGKTANLLALRESFTLAWALTHWLAVEGQVSGGMAAGTDFRSIIRVGLSYAYGGRVSLLGRLLSRGPVYLSLRVDGSVLSVEDAVPQRLLDTVTVDDGTVSFQRPRIVRNGRDYIATPTLALAVGATRWLGFQASGGVRLDWLDLDTTQFKSTLALGAGVSLDLDSVGLNLTILAGGRFLYDMQERSTYITAFGVRNRTRGEAELGFYYSGRRDVDIGLAVVSEVGGKNASVIGNAVMNYYW